MLDEVRHRRIEAKGGRRERGRPTGCDRTAAGRFAALCASYGCCSAAGEARKTGAPALFSESRQPPWLGRPEMSTIMKNKSLLLLPIGLAVLIVIGVLTS
jgi:hypothetical protein